MRVFTTLYIVVTLAFNVNAATIGKEDVSALGSNCVADINFAITNLNDFITSLTDYQEEGESAKTFVSDTFPKVQEKFQTYLADDKALINDINNAYMECCKGFVDPEAKTKSYFRFKGNGKTTSSTIIKVEGQTISGVKKFFTAGANALNKLKSKDAAILTGTPEKTDRLFFKTFFDSNPQLANCLVQRGLGVNAAKVKEDLAKVWMASPGGS